ncbi:MAG: DNA double-strand break repair nuclease NurA [Methanomicrobiales archaeon]|nr:DNA double-strand break repair nuclease NurA [Methanomicrobiales archaeon]
MPSGDPYQESVDKTLYRIRNFLPGDIVERFQEQSGLDSSAFQALEPGIRGTVTGIDGSSSLVLEGGSFSVAAIRAGRSTMQESGTHRLLTPLLLSLLGPESENPDFPALYWECFENDPLTPLDHDDPHGPASVLRDTLEYWVALRAVQTEAPESLVLLDGALRVSHASHDPVLQQIIATAENRQVHLAAVAKRTEATWGGGIPLIPAAEGLASRAGVLPPWWIRIETKILDHMQFRQWQHGDLYIVKLHPHAAVTLKLELPLDQDEQSVHETMQLLAGYADDGRLPGYPYPLLDAHRSVVIDQETVDRIRHDLLRGMTGSGYTFSHYRQLFGDVHDEFRKY